jgi:hypothetical protein
MKPSKRSRTRYRTRRRVDMSRVADGLKMPGIDTRTWVTMARVDVDPDATVWDAELGWLCDVTIVGGPLDGDGPVLCRMASAGAAPGKGQYDPPHQGCLVIVTIPGGDTNADCVIVGQLNDTECLAPVTVNNTNLTEAFARRTHVMAFPDEDFDGEFANVRLTGQMVLGTHNANQPFARGTDLANAIDSFADALSAFVDQAVVPAGTFGNVGLLPFTAAATVLKVAIQQFKLARNQYLSTRIKGT